MDTHHSIDEYVFGNCVRCQGLVRVPVTTRSTATVRCPRCHESFELAKILDQEVPALEIIGDAPTSHADRPDVSVFEATPDERSAKTEDGRFIVPPQLAKAAKRRRHRSSHPVTIDEQEKQPVQSDASQRRRGESRRRSRDRAFQKRRPKRNTFLDVFFVILGGCLSVPVAQMLLWWVVGADPLGLAPHTAKWVPALVPPALRSLDDELSDQTPAENAPASNADTSTPNQRNASDPAPHDGVSIRPGQRDAAPENPGNLSQRLTGPGHRMLASHHFTIGDSR